MILDSSDDMISSDVDICLQAQQLPAFKAELHIRIVQSSEAEIRRDPVGENAIAVISFDVPLRDFPIALVSWCPIVECVIQYADTIIDPR